MLANARALIGRLAATAAAAILLSAVATPALGGTALSPGCVTWNEFGDAGTTMDGTVVDGPFSAGETLTFTASPVHASGEMYISAVEGDPPAQERLWTSSVGGDKSFTLPRDVEALAFAASFQELPFILDYTDMVCFAAGEQPPTDALGKPSPAGLRASGSFLALLLVTAAGLLLAASQPRPSNRRR